MTEPITAQGLNRMAALLDGWADFLAAHDGEPAEVVEHRALADACRAEARAREVLL